MCGNSELWYQLLLFGFHRRFFNNFPNIQYEGLLHLRVKVHLRFLNNNDLAQRSIYFSSHPLKMEVADLNRHIYEVLEPKTVVRFGEFMIENSVNLQKVSASLQGSFWLERGNDLQVPIVN